MKMEYSKMRSESIEYTWKTKGILIHLESYLRKMCTGSLGEKSDGMDPDMHTTLC